MNREVLRIVIATVFFISALLVHDFIWLSLNPWFLVFTIPLLAAALAYFFSVISEYSATAVVIGIILAMISFFGGIWPSILNNLVAGIVFYPTPSIVIFSSLLALIFILDGYINGKDVTKKLGFFFLAIAIIYFIGCVIVAHFGNMDIANWIWSTKVTKLKTLTLDINVDKFRYLPLETSWRYAADSIVFPRYDVPIGTASIVLRNGTPYYQFFVVPSGGLNPYYLDSKGFIEVDMSSVERRYKFYNISFHCGMPNLWMWRGARERILITHLLFPWYIYEDISYITKINGEWVIVVPLAVPEIRWIGIYPYTIPRPWGVALIHRDCRVELVPMDKAVELTKDQILIPDELATWYVKMLNWKYGLGNVLFFKKELFTIPQPEQSENKQPYLVKVNGSIYWFFAVRPVTAQGIYRIFLVTAHAKDVKIYVYELKTPLIGPVRAISYVRKAFPRIDWSRFTGLEPIPIQIGDVLYWRIPIVPNDYRGVATIALVNSITGDVIALSPVGKASTEIIKTNLQRLLLGEEIRINVTKIKNVITIQQILERIDKLIQELQVLKQQIIQLLNKTK